MNQSTVITIDSVQDFKCSMGACEDNCCRNTTWNITVDKATYEKYKNMDDDAGRHILDNIETVDNEYRFKQFEHGHCPLLTEEGLCHIHKNLGEKYLCTACSTYPKMWDNFNGKLEHWLSLSCPTVVRNIIFGKKKVNFVGLTADIKKNALPPMASEPEHNTVRTLLFEIIDCRDISLKDKLLYMGLYMRTLDKSGDVNKVTQTYRNNIRTKGLLETIKADLGNMEINTRQDFFQNLASIAAKLIKPSEVKPKGIKNAEYYEMVESFYKDVNDETSKSYLSVAFDRNIVPYVNKNPNVFINYLMYTVFSSGFLRDSENYAQAYSGFVGEFLTMLTFAAGLFNNEKTVGKKEIATAIYLYHRKVSHSSKLRKMLAEIFTDDVFVLLVGALGEIK
ncbi:MAG: flagellin lysine-N-methylase [Defluviitaleaceae bacterium]|nr:flagellin lysine-N-methylase [Defluviitaleaceae bacterium]